MWSPRLRFLIVAFTFTFFIAATQSLDIHHVKFNLSNTLPKRAEHNPPPCPPEGRREPFSIKTDEGPECLPYTAEIIRAATGLPLRSRSSILTSINTAVSNLKRAAIKVTKRANGHVRQLYMISDTKVLTDHSMFYHFDVTRDLTTQGLATRDLCGCTVAVVSSPFATIMAHVWERRAEDSWMTDPFGPQQAAKDAEFVRKGEELFENVLSGMGTVENDYMGIFPKHQTSVAIVAPGFNPDYVLGPGGRTNPDYVRMPNDIRTGDELIYPVAAKNLKDALVKKFIPGRGDNQSKMLKYRRRYWTDPNHQMDDREFVVLKPVASNDGKVYLHLYYDDVREFRVARLA